MELGDKHVAISADSALIKQGKTIEAVLEMNDVRTAQRCLASRISVCNHA